MRVAVLCQDALTRDGLSSILARIQNVICLEGDGRLNSIGVAARRGDLDAIVIPLDGLGQDDLSSLKSLKLATSVRLIGVVPGNTIATAWADVLDKAVPRSAGAQGIRQALAALGMARRQPAYSIREAAVIYNSAPRLTRRENQVAQLVAQGMSNRRIAVLLGIREQSVKNLVSVLMRKLDCENRVQVALHLTQYGAFTNKL